MILEALELRNCRGFPPEHGPILFERDVTVLVGPNDTGKTNILRALASYSDHQQLDGQKHRSRGSGASRKPGVVSAWFIPEGAGRRKKWKQLTRSQNPPSRVKIRSTPDRVSCWPSEERGKDAPNLPSSNAEALLPSPWLCDLVEARSLPAIPHTLDKLNYIKGEQGQLVRQILELADCDIEDLLAADFNLKRQRLRAAYRAFNQRLRHLMPDAPRLELTLHKDGRLDIDFNEADILFEPSERGYGLRQLLGIVVQVLHLDKAQSNDPLELILMDEPETGLHPGAQAVLRDFLQQTAQTKGHQVVYATHSPFMIDPNRIRQVRLVGKEGTTCVVENRPWRRLHEEPIRSALQMPLGYSLFLGQRNVIVEGMCDQVLLVALSQACAAHDMAHLDLRRTSIAPAGGAGQSLFGCLAARASRRDAYVAAVQDKDEAGCQALKRAREAGYECTLFVDGTPFNGEELGSPEFTVEDLVPSRVYLQAFTTNYQTVESGGGLSPDAISTGKMADLLKEQQIERPILEACKQFTCRELNGSGYDFRKHDLAQEAAFLLLEGMPVGLEDAHGDALYTKADLKPAAKLFRETNRWFEHAGESA